MARYNRVLLNYLKDAMSPDGFAIFLDLIDQDEDVESFYNEKTEEEDVEKEEKVIKERVIKEKKIVKKK